MNAKHALMQLDRLAQRRQELGGELLKRALAGRVEELAETAIQVAVEVGDPIGSVLAEGIPCAASPDLVEHLQALCLEDEYRESVPLREIHQITVSLCIDSYLATWPDPDDEQKLELAGLFNNLANALGSLGREREALEAARESVDRYRKLALTCFERYILDHATALDTLGKRLGDLGRWSEACIAAKESVDVLRQAPFSSSIVLLGLARSLNGLANHLGFRGRLQEALEAVEESVRIKRRLIVASSSTDRLSSLASTLNDMSVWLREVDRVKDALRAAREASDIYRQLAADRPDAYLPDLAMSLDNLGSILEGTEPREDALAVSEESVKIYRDLVTYRSVFKAHLARSLGNLGILLGSLGRFGDAVRALRECVDHYRGMVDDNPKKIFPPLAGNLNNLANQLGELSREKETLELFEEVVLVQYRLLEESESDVVLFDLSRYLNNQGLWLSHFGHHKRALVAMRKSVELRRRLVASQPEAFRSYLVGSLDNLSSQLCEMNLWQDALQVTREAVQHCLDLFDLSGDLSILDIARRLVVMSAHFRECHSLREAYEANQGAVECYQKLAEADPGTYREFLVESLDHLFELSDVIDLG